MNELLYGVIVLKLELIKLIFLFSALSVKLSQNVNDIGYHWLRAHSLLRDELGRHWVYAASPCLVESTFPTRLSPFESGHVFSLHLHGCCYFRWKVRVKSHFLFKIRCWRESNCIYCVLLCNFVTFNKIFHFHLFPLVHTRATSQKKIYPFASVWYKINLSHDSIP